MKKEFYILVITLLILSFFHNFKPSHELILKRDSVKKKTKTEDKKELR
jgi:hypothetical protein